jgi:hypothetical protein
MNLFATCLLSLAATQIPQSDEAAIRQLAWQLHQQQPNAAELIAQWQQPGLDQDLFLAAASRGLAGQDCASALLVELLQAKPSDSPSPAMLDFLRSVDPHADAVPLLQDLHSRPAWRVAVAETLLRWGIYPAQPQHALAVDLLAKLRGGWMPANDHLAAVLLLGDDFRAVVLPQLLNRYNLTAEQWQSLHSLSRQQWDPFHAVALDAVLLNQAAAPSDPVDRVDVKDLLRRCWDLYLLPELALGQKQMLEQILTQHSTQVSESMVEQALTNAEPEAKNVALDFFRRRPMACGIPLMLANAQQEMDPIEGRIACVKALFLIASDDDLQPLVLQLKPGMDSQLQRTMLSGLRLRPLKLTPGTIESLLPKLRTNDAGLAMEVLMLTAEHEVRLQWLPKVAALPPAVAHRVMEMAWGTDPHPDLLQAFRDMSQAKQDRRRVLGSAGLRAALSDAELAAHYEALLKQAKDPQRFDEYLNELRDQRTDAALEVILDWLISAGGRGNPRSASFASLLIEEDLAARMFQSWWQNQDGLTNTQLDWTACHLSPNSADARQYLIARFDQVDARSQTMFLTRMLEGAGETELALWSRVLQDFRYDVAVRRVAAHLTFRTVIELDHAAARAWVEPTMQALANSNDSDYADRAWLVLARGLTGVPQLQWRQQWLETLRGLPTEYSQAFQRAWYLGSADHPLAEQLPSLQDAMLAELQKPSFGEIVGQSRPKYQQLADRYFDFFHLCVALQAHQPTPEQDQQLADRILQLGTASLADCLSLLPPAMTSWPLTGATAKKILTATEARNSFRYPPAEAEAQQPPMSAYLANTEFFDEFRRRYDAGQFVGLKEACEMAKQRWPRDRRSFLWSGWLALSSGQMDDAQSAFEHALGLSGWMSYVRMEPNLGLAATASMRSQDGPQLRRYLDLNNQTDKLLRGRIVHGLLPELSAIVGEEEGE